LVVTKGRLGVELEQPFGLAPVTVRELSLSLPDIAFPVELTGGIAAFRNRRGDLENVELHLAGRPLARWAAGRLAGILGSTKPACVAAPLEDGWLFGLQHEAAALAFEVLVAPLDADIRLLPTAARGLGLGAPPQALAIRALRALTGSQAKLVGGAVVFEDVAAAVSRNLLPLAGMRAAAADRLRWASVEFGVSGVSIRAAAQAVPAEHTERVIRAIELATLVAEADDALLRGSLDEARRAYVAALEQAPRHPEIARRIAEIDRCVGGRAEAALGTISEAMPVIEAGVLAGQLLAEVGDGDAARAALERAARHEAYGPLAALAWRELASQCEDRHDQAEALDEAIARGPSLTQARWQRFDLRLRLGDSRGAREDIEQLEAQAQGAAQRHEVLQTAARTLLDRGIHDEALELFEKALRYVPDNVDSVAGLARSLALLGHRRRALELLGRAVALAERSSRPAYEVRLELARALVDVADELPTAIAHVRTVPAFEAETFEARLLEARWRAQLGDLAGANAALNRLADAVEHAIGVLTEGPETHSSRFVPLWGRSRRWPTKQDARAAIAALLREGAAIEELDRGAMHEARRHLALALRLTPQHRELKQDFRRVLSAMGTSAKNAPAIVDQAIASEPGPQSTTLDAPFEQSGTQVGVSSPMTTERIPSERPTVPGGYERTDPVPSSAMPTAVRELDEDDELAPGRSDDEPTGTFGDPDDELRVERLSEKLRADPDDAGVVAELVALLEKLGRDLDLLALLSARIDEGSELLRPELVKQRRAVLERLVATARAAGNDSEADVYALMLSRAE